MKYHSHYSDKTFIKFGQLATPDEVKARQIALREYNLSPIGEVWVQGYGYTCLFDGPELDEETQNLLCIIKVPQ